MQVLALLGLILSCQPGDVGGGWAKNGVKQTKRRNSVWSKNKSSAAATPNPFLRSSTPKNASRRRNLSSYSFSASDPAANSVSNFAVSGIALGIAHH